MWWLTLAAMAQEAPPAGQIVLVTSPGTEVEVVPRARPETIELLIRGNDKPLDLQIDRQRTDHIADAWATSMGSGAWFMTLYVVNDRIEVRPRFEEGVGWVLATRELASPVPLRPEPPASVEDLTANRVDRRPARLPEIPLSPLTGDAWAPRLDPREVRLPLDPWVPPLPGGPEGPPTLALADALRIHLASLEDEQGRTHTLQHLALLHQRLGLHREARYYFDEVSRKKTDWPKATVQLHRADAALATGRFDEALQRCQEARAAGADPVASLVCIGGVALAQGSPSPTDIGRSLAATTQEPRARVLAAQLLMIDGRPAEAGPILENLPPLPGDWQRWRDATLGDVRLFAGEWELARAAWADVGTEGELGEIAEQRARLLRLVTEPPAAWASELPALERDSKQGGWVGPEAHHLAAQIARAYDELPMAARHLGAMVDRWPDLATRAGANQRLLSTCERRLRLLHEAGRLADEAGFYLDCWRPVLDRIAPGIESRTRVAEAFAALGLWEEALGVQREVTAALARDDREDAGALLDLAGMYAEVGQYREALETVRYARRELTEARQDRRFDLVAGRAALGLDDPEGALAAWRVAERDPRIGAEARVRAAMVWAEGGDCGRALPILESFTQGDRQLQTPAIDLADARLSVARCLLETGAGDPALALSLRTATEAPDTLWAEQAIWNAGYALALLPGRPLPEAPLAPPDPWVAVVTELRRVEDVERRLERVRKRTPR